MATITTKPTPQAAVWGTSVTQGMRVGPAAINEGSTPVSSTVFAPQATPRYEMDQWGPGVYTGGLFTYRILPTPVNETSTTPITEGGRDNIVASNTTAVFFGFTTPTSLPLSGATGTPRPNQRITVNGKPKLVFDYPRCINLYVDASQTADVYIRVYGSDLYGQLMMEEILNVGAAGTAGQTRTAVGRKAFSQVDYVFMFAITGTIANNLPMGVGTSNSFGLPFALSQGSHMVAYSQSDADLQTASASGKYPGYIEGSYDWPQSYLVGGPTLYPYNITTPDTIFGADVTAVGVSTGDVRGTVRPNSGLKQTMITTPFAFNGPLVVDATKGWWASPNPYLTITYYIAGADMYQNQILAQRQALLGLVADQSIFSGMWSTLAPNRDTDGMKGLKQYWEAPPGV